MDVRRLHDGGDEEGAALANTLGLDTYPARWARPKPDDGAVVAACRKQLAAAIKTHGAMSEKSLGLMDVLGTRLQEEVSALESRGKLEDAASKLALINKLAEAEALLRQALASSTAMMGAVSGSTLALKSNLAGLLMKRGRSEALDLYTELLEGRKASLGPRHAQTLLAMNNLGGVLWRAGKPVEAAACYREALEIQREDLGGQHKETLASLANLAELLQEEGRVDDAAPLLLELREASQT